MSERAHHEPSVRPILTIVMPVYDGAATIVENVETVRRVVEPQIDGDVELIVVSDGSLDATEEVLLDSRPRTGARVIHYDRNLGKGYAVRAGALAARGQWIAFIDADLDLDPSSIPVYLEIARSEGLDFAIGSKRHPDSVVHYPRSRRIASWCYQKLNRLLFRLDVRDTQVGVKVFSREIADNILPLLLVKQFAFDLELLAVSNALGYRKVRELPIVLDYRFTGSGVRSRAVFLALVDTAAVFYRLRILRTYQRKQRLLQPQRVNGSAGQQVTVTLVGGSEALARRLDYSAVEVAEGSDRATAAAAARGELLALLAPGARPAGNWLSAAAAFFVRHSVAAVVVPAMAPRDAPLREQVAAGILESRFGAGSRRIRYIPGNVRLVDDHPAASIVVRRREYLDAVESGIPEDRIVAWLVNRGLEVVYTPETIIVDSAAPVLRPHLRAVADHARSRGVIARQTRGRSMNPRRLLGLAPFALWITGIVLVLAGGAAHDVGLALELAYLATLAGAAGTAALRFRSGRVGLLTVPALAATHAVYASSFARAMIRGR